MDLLVVEQVGGLQEALITEVTLEGTIGRVFVRAAVAYKRILLFEAHLALLALERPLFRVGTLMLPQVGRALEALAAGATAEWPLSFWLALMVQELR